MANDQCNVRLIWHKEIEGCNAFERFHIWRETPIALDEWLAEVSDAREWDRHTIRLGRIPSTGMTVPIGGTPGYVWWMGHSSRDSVAFEFLDGEIRTTDPDEETLKKIRE